MTPSTCCRRRVALGPVLALALLAFARVPVHAADAPAGDVPLRVMSFNLRYDEPKDGSNAWPHRRDMVASMIRFHDADLVGVQEALAPMLADLQERLPSHAWLGVGRADGKSGGEFSAIFYRTDRLELVDRGTFWLSETPEVPGSKSWDAALERIVTWARFRDRRTGKAFYHFNTHFDHQGEQARLESAKLLLRRLREKAGDGPALVTGDLNTVPGSAPYLTLTEAGPQDDASPRPLRDALTVSEQPPHGPTGTWNGFKAIEPGHRIDFVFVTDDVRVLRHGILSDTWDGRFPSDHLPVLAEIALQ